MSDFTYSIGFKTDESGLQTLQKAFDKLDKEISKTQRSIESMNKKGQDTSALQKTLGEQYNKLELVTKAFGELDTALKKAAQAGMNLESKQVQVNQTHLKTATILKDLVSLTEKHASAMNKDAAAVQGMISPELLAFMNGMQKSFNGLTESIEKQTSAYNKNAEAQKKAQEERRKQIQENIKNRQQQQADEEPTPVPGSGFTNRAFATVKQALLTAPIYQTAYTVTSGIQNTINDYIKLDTVLNRIAIVTGQTTDSVREMKEEFSAAARTLGTSTEEYAKGIETFLAQGGRAADNAKELATASIQLANATGQSADDTSQYVTAIGNSFKLIDKGQPGIQKIADTLLYLDNASATSADEIGKAMQRSASSFESAGVEYDRAAAMIAVSSEVTRLAPERVGTAFKTIIENIQTVNKQGPKEIKEFSNKIQQTIENFPSLKDKLKLFDETGTEMVPMTEFLTQLQDTFSTIGKTDPMAANALAQAIGGKENANVLSALLENYDRFQELFSGAKTESEGAAAKAQAEKLNSLQSKINVMKQAWEEFTNKLISSGAITNFLESLTKVIDAINSALGESHQLLKIIGLLLSVYLIKNFKDFDKFFRGTGDNIKNIGTKLGEVIAVARGGIPFSTKNIIVEAKAAEKALKDLEVEMKRVEFQKNISSSEKVLGRKNLKDKTRKKHEENLAENKRQLSELEIQETEYTKKIEAGKVAAAEAAAKGSLASRAGGFLKSGAKTLGKVGIPGMLVSGALTIGMDKLGGDERSIADIAKDEAGNMIGGGLGAAIGTLIAGPVGTVVGSMIGSWVGSNVQEWIGKKGKEEAAKDAERQEAIKTLAALEDKKRQGLSLSKDEANQYTELSFKLSEYSTEVNKAVGELEDLRNLQVEFASKSSNYFDSLVSAANGARDSIAGVVTAYKELLDQGNKISVQEQVKLLKDYTNELFDKNFMFTKAKREATLNAIDSAAMSTDKPPSQALAELVATNPELNYAAGPGQEHEKSFNTLLGKVRGLALPSDQNTKAMLGAQSIYQKADNIDYAELIKATAEFGKESGSFKLDQESLLKFKKEDQPKVRGGIKKLVQYVSEYSKVSKMLPDLGVLNNIEEVNAQKSKVAGLGTTPSGVKINPNDIAVTYSASEAKELNQKKSDFLYDRIYTNVRDNIQTKLGQDVLKAFDNKSIINPKSAVDFNQLDPTYSTLTKGLDETKKQTLIAILSSFFSNAESVLNLTTKAGYAQYNSMLPTGSFLQSAAPSGTPIEIHTLAQGSANIIKEFMSPTTTTGTTPPPELGEYTGLNPIIDLLKKEKADPGAEVNRILKLLDMRIQNIKDGNGTAEEKLNKLTKLYEYRISLLKRAKEVYKKALEDSKKELLGIVKADAGALGKTALKDAGDGFFTEGSIAAVKSKLEDNVISLQKKLQGMGKRVEADSTKGITGNAQSYDQMQRSVENAKKSLDDFNTRVGQYENNASKSIEATDKLTDSLRQLKDEYMKMKEDVLKQDFTEALFGKSSVDKVKEYFNTITSYQKKYANSVEKTLSIAQLQNKVEQDRLKYGSNPQFATFQQKLTTMKKDGKKYTEEELKLLTAEYDVYLKQVLLKRAEQGSQETRLMRDAAGNWIYGAVPTSGNKAEEAANAKGNLEDAAAKFYEMSQDAFTNTNKQMIDIADKISSTEAEIAKYSMILKDSSRTKEEKEMATATLVDLKGTRDILMADLKATQETRDREVVTLEKAAVIAAAAAGEDPVLKGLLENITTSTEDKVKELVTKKLPEDLKEITKGSMAEIQSQLSTMGTTLGTLGVDITTLANTIGKEGVLTKAFSDFNEAIYKAIGEMETYFENLNKGAGAATSGVSKDTTGDGDGKQVFKDGDKNDKGQIYHGGKWYSQSEYDKITNKQDKGASKKKLPTSHAGQIARALKDADIISAGGPKAAEAAIDLEKVQANAKALGYEKELNDALKDRHEKKLKEKQASSKISKDDKHKQYVAGQIARALKDLNKGDKNSLDDFEKVIKDSDTKGYRKELEDAVFKRAAGTEGKQEALSKVDERIFSNPAVKNFLAPYVSEHNDKISFDAAAVEATGAAKQVVQVFADAQTRVTEKIEAEDIIQISKERYKQLSKDAKTETDPIKLAGIKLAQEEAHKNANNARITKANEVNEKIRAEQAKWAAADKASDAIPATTKNKDLLDQKKGFEKQKQDASIEARKLRDEFKRILKEAGTDAKNFPAMLDTGGYTGAFAGGKIGVLHEKELILNKQDTKNILDSVKISREMASSFATNAKQVFSSVSNQDSSASTTIINASFPNVSSSEEIRKAFANMSNSASQFAYKMKSAY
jgi:TP901 family phage tail tape measure protein